MNWDRIEGKWLQLRGTVKEGWGKLTHDQWNIIDGQRDQRAGKDQESYGIGIDETARKIRDRRRYNYRSTHS